MKLSTALHGTTEHLGTITRTIHLDQENQMIIVLVIQNFQLFPNFWSVKFVKTELFQRFAEPVVCKNRKSFCFHKVWWPKFVTELTEFAQKAETEIIPSYLAIPSR